MVYRPSDPQGGLLRRWARGLYRSRCRDRSRAFIYQEFEKILMRYQENSSYLARRNADFAWINASSFRRRFDFKSGMARHKLTLAAGDS
jgi:hypothetical protein